MKVSHQTYEIKAPLEKVWWSLTTAEAAEQWGAGPAKFELREGGQFSYWGGDIHGTNIKIVPMKLLRQHWYGHDDPSEKFVVEFVFEGKRDSTTINFTYSGNILNEEKDMKDWQEYYFNPIKKLLEA